MLVQVVLSTEHLLTVLALEALRPRMRGPVPQEMLLPVERLVTLLTLERPDSLVQLHVLRQVLFPLKLLLADVTGWPGRLVHLQDQRSLPRWNRIDCLEGNHLGGLCHRHRLDLILLSRSRDHLDGLLIGHNNGPGHLVGSHLGRSIISSRLHQNRC